MLAFLQSLDSQDAYDIFFVTKTAFSRKNLQGVLANVVFLASNDKSVSAGSKNSLN